MGPRFGLGLAAAFAGGTAYGLNAPFATMADRMGVPGADAVFWRALLMLVICAGLVALGTRTLRLPSAARGPLLLLGLATSLTSISYLSAVAYVPVAVAAVVFYTFPVIILVLSPMVDGERITPARVGVFMAAFVGVAVVVGPDLAGLDLRGLVLASAASVGAATMMFVGTRVMTAAPAEVASFWVHILVVPIAFAVTLVLGGPARLPATGEFALAFGIIAGSYVLGFLFQLVALRHLPAVVAGLVFLIEPVVAILTAAIVLGERLSPTQYMGCAAVLAALVASTLVERRELERRKITP